MPSSSGERLTRTSYGTLVRRWCPTQLLFVQSLLLPVLLPVLLLLVLLPLLVTDPKAKPEDHEQQEPNRPTNGAANNRRKIFPTSILSAECIFSCITWVSINPQLLWQVQTQRTLFPQTPTSHYWRLP